MKPRSIRSILDAQGIARPSLRVVKDSTPTARLPLPDWHERKRQSAAVSAWVLLILVMLLGAAGGIGLVLAALRLK